MYRNLLQLFLVGLLALSCVRARFKDAADAINQARAAQSRAEELKAGEIDPEAAQIARTILEEAEVQQKEGADPRTVTTLAERARALYEQLISKARETPPEGVDVAKDKDTSQPSVQ